MKKIIILAFTVLSLLTACQTITNLTYEIKDKIPGLNETETSQEQDKEISESEDTQVFYEVSKEQAEALNKLEKEKSKEEFTKTLKINPKDLNSRNVFLMNYDTGEIMFTKNEEEVVFPASLTKIITTIVAIENCQDLTKTYALDEDLYLELINADASMAGFSPGEEVGVIDLAYGTMMPSGADASIGLSELCTGSVDSHVEAMNRLVRKLGLKKTNFTNVTGLHDDDNYSTARDLADIMVYCLDNKVFSEIISQPSHTTQATDYHPEGISLSYSVRDYADAHGVEGYQILGGKTGFTEEAGLCLASVAEIDGKTYILVTLGSAAQDGHYIDAINIYNKIHENNDKLASI